MNDHVCIVCGVSLAGRRSDARFCSLPCRRGAEAADKTRGALDDLREADLDLMRRAGLDP